MDSRSTSTSNLSRKPPLIAALLFAGCIGCGGVKLVPVTGEVKLDGVPVADCAVMFNPVGGGPAASAATDSQGHFQLSTMNRPGVVPGEHYVTIAKQRTTGMVGDVPGPDGVHTEWLVPQKYSRPESSGLRKNVSLQEHEFLFELSSK